MTFFRIIHEQLGRHVHMRIFSGKNGQSLGMAGTLCMTESEFADFKKYLGDQAEFIERKSS